MDSPVLSLFELNRTIRNYISAGFSEYFWVRAETSDVRENQNGHCYLEFIERNESNKNVIAKARASIWANVYKMLKMYFESETGQPFVSGIKVLVLVSVEFHELYGFSLNVHNIDPSYTLGDQARNRTMILRQLEEEGVINLNKELELPYIVNRIAVISSPTAAGYEDFCNQLNNNKRGFQFYIRLFPAIMQGDKTEDSILTALDRINDCIEAFDTVVIIRGGGATSELSAFDSYLLAASCAQFPIPVITGIGHERDDTVLDIVSHTRVKTPTAAAEFLINSMEETEIHLFGLQERIVGNVNQQLLQEKNRINMLANTFSYLLKGKNKEQINTLNRYVQRLRLSADNFIHEKKYELESHEQFIRLSSPENILKKGYTLTLKDRKVVKSSTALQSGDKIETVFKDGAITSVID